MRFSSCSKPRLGWLAALVAVLLVCTNSHAQSRSGDGRSSTQRVTIEPYTGPPVYLDQAEQIAPPQVVERKTVRNETFEGTDQVRVERDIVLFSDDHFEADGAYREYYPNGQLFVEGTFNRGRQNGDWTYYHPDGQINRKASYTNGQPNGSWEVYRADGTLAVKRAFSAGKRDGEWIHYDPTGKTPIREEHYVDGKQHGVWKTWYPDGKPKQEVSFRDGMKHGPSKEWDENGELRADVNYVENKLDGTATVILPNGQKVVQQYEAGRLVSDNRN